MAQASYGTGAADRQLRAAASDESVLGTAHFILGAFSGETQNLRLTELSRRCGVPKATVYRLSEQLVELGYLAKTHAGYELGWRLFQMGKLVPGPARLVESARPTLIDLRDAMRASVVHLAVLRGIECHYLEHISGRLDAQVVAAVDSGVPALSTACGRVLLADRDESRAEDLAASLTSVEKVGKLRDVFAEIRARRWAGEFGERVSGMRSLAVPVKYSADGPLIAALSVTVASARKDDRTILNALWTASREITRGMEYSWPVRLAGEPRPAA